MAFIYKYDNLLSKYPKNIYDGYKYDDFLFKKRQYTLINITSKATDKMKMRAWDIKYYKYH